MQLIIQVQDHLKEPIKDKLPAPEMGILEAVALDAVLGSPTECGATGPETTSETDF